MVTLPLVIQKNRTVIPKKKLFYEAVQNKDDSSIIELKEIPITSQDEKNIPGPVFDDVFAWSHA